MAPLPKYFRLALVNRANRAVNFGDKEFALDNNLYWNNGSSVDPSVSETATVDKDTFIFVPTVDDENALTGDPVMDNPFEDCTVASWNDSTYEFASGETNIFDEHARLVEAHAVLGAESAALGVANATNMPDHDIRQRAYTGDPNVGCYQSTGSPATKPSAPSGTGTTYYVDPAGDDSTGDGSAGDPWKTIYYAMTQLSGGDTLICNDGTYSASIGYTKVSQKFSSTVYVVAANQYKAKLIGSLGLVRGLAVYNAANVHFWGLDVTGEGGTGGEYLVHISVTDGTYCENITFENCMFRNGGTGQSSQDVMKINVFPDNIVFRSCLFSHADTTYVQQFFDINCCTNITIEDCIFAHDVTTYQNFRSFIIIKNSSTNYPETTEDIIIRRNIFHNYQGGYSYSHIQLGEDVYATQYEATDVLIENNLFIFNDTGNASNYAASPILIYHAVRDVLFRANTVVGHRHRCMFLLLGQTHPRQRKHYPPAIRYPFYPRTSRNIVAYNNIFADPVNTAGTSEEDARWGAFSIDYFTYNGWGLARDKTDTITIKGVPWKRHGHSIVYGDEITLLTLSESDVATNSVFIEDDYVFGSTIDNTATHWDGVLCTVTSSPYAQLQDARYWFSEHANLRVCLDASHDGEQWASSTSRLRSETSSRVSDAYLQTIYAGAADVTAVVTIIDTSALVTGAPLEGVTYDEITVSYTHTTHGGAETNGTLTLTPISSEDSHTDGGFVELGDGEYRIDVPDTLLRTGTRSLKLTIEDAGDNGIGTSYYLFHQFARGVDIPLASPRIWPCGRSSDVILQDLPVVVSLRPETRMHTFSIGLPHAIT